MFMGFLRWQDFTQIQYTNKNKIVKDNFSVFSSTVAVEYKT